MEEASERVPDTTEGLLADNGGVNSSVSLSLQGVEVTDHQRLEGHTLADWPSQNWPMVRAETLQGCAVLESTLTSRACRDACLC